MCKRANAASTALVNVDTPDALQMRIDEPPRDVRRMADLGVGATYPGTPRTLAVQIDMVGDVELCIVVGFAADRVSKTSADEVFSLHVLAGAPGFSFAVMAGDAMPVSVSTTLLISRSACVWRRST